MSKNNPWNEKGDWWHEDRKSRATGSSSGHGSGGYGSGGYGAGKDPYVGTIPTKRCYHGHPALPIKVGDLTYLIHGGSCSTPVVTDAGVYVGLDSGMPRTKRGYPWTEGFEVFFKIQDMGVPDDPEQFKKLIEWLALQLAADQKVHVGCIGGHGRTGMVLAALVRHMTGDPDAITYVRKHYCMKAVESAEQVRFLNKHFGTNLVAGAKEGLFPAKTVVSAAGSGSGPRPEVTIPVYQAQENLPLGIAERSGKSKTRPKGKMIQPVKSQKAIW